MTPRPAVPASATHCHAQPKPELEVQAVVLLAQSAGDVFQRCVDLALLTTRGTTAMIVLTCSGAEVLEVVAASGHLAERAVGRRLARGEALSWRVVDSGEVQLVERPHASPDAHFLSGQRRAGMYLGVPLLDPEGRVLGVLCADTTDSDERLGEADARSLLLLGQAAGVAYSRWLALEHAQATARQFERVARLSADLEGLSQPTDIARHALGALIELSGFTTGAVFDVTPDGLVRLSVLEGDQGHGILDSPELRTPHPPRGLVAQVVGSGLSRAVMDYPSWRGAPPASGIQTAVAAPLRSGGRVVGVIGLMHVHGQHEVPPQVIALLEMVAARIERATERAAGVQHLQQMREAALRAVGRVLESRDGETYGHTDRVTTLSVRLGGALGLDAEQLQHLCWGAYLHDIGKVAVSDAVLRKPGPLTVDERRLVQRHVLVGDEMLRDDAFVPSAVRAVVRWHHERWDGGGYPDGLGAGQIPLLARVFSVVDVYDALVSERPYKRAWSRDEALAELIRCAGTQFDPQIVAVFRTLV